MRRIVNGLAETKLCTGYPQGRLYMLYLLYGKRKGKVSNGDFDG